MTRTFPPSLVRIKQIERAENLKVKERYERERRQLESDRIEAQRRDARRASGYADELAERKEIELRISEQEVAIAVFTERRSEIKCAERDVPQRDVDPIRQRDAIRVYCAGLADLQREIPFLEEAIKFRQEALEDLKGRAGCIDRGLHSDLFERLKEWQDRELEPERERILAVPESTHI